MYKMRQDVRLFSYCLAIMLWFSSFMTLYPSLHIYAQEQNTQAVPSDEGGPIKIRCSSGSLVDTAAECPSSGECPSSIPIHTGLLQCSSAPKDNLDRSTEQPGSRVKFQSINITTDKRIYKPGEVVNITIKNTGATTLTFPNSILGLTIENAVTHDKYPLLSKQSITTLDSGGQKTIKWDQKDTFGQQVKEGNYTAFAHSGLINASRTFYIMK
jgi:hypothetical protein